MDEAEEVVGGEVYSSKKEDPQFLLTFVDKYVTVQLIKDIELCGFVYSIDPLTSSVILQIPKEDSFGSAIIPGHAILDMTITPIPDTVRPPAPKTHKPAYTEDTEELLARKKKVTAWFKKNFLTGKDDGMDIVVGSARVLPPYGPTDIYAENSVVATQIRKLVGNMPAFFYYK